MSCEHENRKRCGECYEEGFLVEYKVKCEDCGKTIALWSYGEYEDLEEEE